jgi:hypothetical protein
MAVVKEHASHRLVRSTFERVLELTRMSVKSQTAEHLAARSASCLWLTCDQGVLEILNQRVSNQMSRSTGSSPRMLIRTMCL